MDSKPSADYVPEDEEQARNADPGRWTEPPNHSELNDSSKQELFEDCRSVRQRDHNEHEYQRLSRHGRVDARSDRLWQHQWKGEQEHGGGGEQQTRQQAIARTAPHSPEFEADFARTQVLAPDRPGNHQPAKDDFPEVNQPLTIRVRRLPEDEEVING